MFAPLVSLIPIYLLILLGYVAIRSGLIDPAGLPHISRFALYICIPVVVASAVSRVGGTSQFNPQFIAGYALASFLVMLAAALVLRRLFGMGPGAAWVLGLGAGASNSMFLGLPIALILIPDLVDTLIVHVVVTENIFGIPVAVTIADVVARTRRLSTAEAIRDTLRRMAVNPALLGLVAGLICAASGLPLPAPLETTRTLMIAAAPVLALFVVGGTVAGARMTEIGGPVFLVAFGKLVVHPAVVYAVLMILPGVPSELAVGGLIFACVPMLSIYTIFAARHGAERIAASAMGVTTLAGAITVGAVVMLLHG
ncbi:AEC family transporter [Tropicimonas isoalkanivorans]|uniref:Permease n=1 Tax=Tropicimonas isoalkanivorans TaxID=441112 RepID=A0A1I1M1H8_9RHOB|nr:AEC family transporter [Tropicimonas isoalkanivorans]SFC79231.1 hypothetical protein SAMN04488094_109116 [Tropicimonas isoalkanivorans]